jgi:hypothetical protein
MPSIKRKSPWERLGWSMGANEKIIFVNSRKYKFCDDHHNDKGLSSVD